MNKPLSKEERSSLGKLCSAEMKAALSAEAYWREAVKTVEMYRDAIGFVDDALTTCPFCENCEDYEVRGTVVHASDCPWLLSQERE